MWQRFTENARKVVFFAQEEAGMLGENYVSTEHLLLGIVRVPESIGAQMLEGLGIKLEVVRASVKAFVRQGKGRTGQNMQLTPRAKRVIDLAYDEARQLRHNYIGAEHLLLGLRREEDGVAARVLIGLGVTLEALHESLPQFQNKDAASGGALPPASKFQNLASYMKAALDTDQVKASKELLSLDEAVKFLGTSKPTLYRLLGQGEIKGLKVGRQWRFRKTDLVAYMERGPALATPATAPSDVPREDLEKALAFLNRELEWFNDDVTLLPSSLARQILVSALKAEAGDVHLELDAEGLRVRYRIGSDLREALHLPVILGGPVLAEYKTLAGLNAGETQMPQDGRMLFTYDGRGFDIRVSTLPAVGGEAMTLHISDGSTARLGLGDLGLTPEDFQKIYGLIQEAKGIVLATGPAGSGRTTLLYACLAEVAGADKKTLTVEDPVAVPLPYVTQMQVNPSAGLTVAAALRALGRQDADVVLVSSLGDLETVGLAMELTLSGQLVLAAQGADSAAAALSGLLELGAKPPLVAATVTGIVAVRLVRKLCNACKLPADVSALPALRALLTQAAEGGHQAPAGTTFFQAVGCEQCRGKGYTGEIGLYEVLTMTEPLAEAVLRRAPVGELTAIAIAGGMRSLLADGVRKAAAGKTTLEEVLRVVS